MIVSTFPVHTAPRRGARPWIRSRCAVPRGTPVISRTRLSHGVDEHPLRACYCTCKWETQSVIPPRRPSGASLTFTAAEIQVHAARRATEASPNRHAPRVLPAPHGGGPASPTPHLTQPGRRVPTVPTALCSPPGAVPVQGPLTPPWDSAIFSQNAVADARRNPRRLSPPAETWARTCTEHGRGLLLCVRPLLCATRWCLELIAELVECACDSKSRCLTPRMSQMRSEVTAQPQEGLRPRPRHTFPRTPRHTGVAALLPCGHGASVSPTDHSLSRPQQSPSPSYMSHLSHSREGQKDD